MCAAQTKCTPLKPNTVSGISGRKNALKIKTKSPKDGSKSGKKIKIGKNLSVKNTHQELTSKNELNSAQILLDTVKIRLCRLIVSPWNQQTRNGVGSYTQQRNHARFLLPGFWLDTVTATHGCTVLWLVGCSCQSSPVTSHTRTELHWFIDLSALRTSCGWIYRPWKLQTSILCCVFVFFSIKAESRSCAEMFLETDG